MSESAAFKPRWNSLRWRDARDASDIFTRYCKVYANGAPFVTYEQPRNGIVEIWERADGTYDWDDYRNAPYDGHHIKHISALEVQALLMENWP